MNDDLIRRGPLESVAEKLLLGLAEPIDLIRAITRAPAVDAVEVVRCKDCKHSRERDKDEQRYLIEGVLVCTSIDATNDCCNAVWPDHFCSYGVRREDDG